MIIQQVYGGQFEDHDRGLAHDLEIARILNRRRALGLLGAAGGAAFLAGCGGDDAMASSTGTSATASPTPTPTPTATATPTPSPTSTASTGSCTADPQETNGPFPADGTNQSRGSTSNVLPITAFQRSDIRASVIGSSTVAAGVQTQLTLTLADVNSSCAPLAGYAVYIWHCNAQGQYSLYDVPAESYLRGIQVSDANGQVSFTTIFPGCYSGRYPHIHFEVFSSLANATAGNYARLVSQLAMPAAACQAIYADTATYGSSLANFGNISIARDNVFGDNTSAQVAAMTPSITGSPSAGYQATATVGLST